MKKPILNKLSQEVVNQIAAGEVVERPSSVVKELVDNSIDAGATEIRISVKNGGIDYIEVSDNGVGIPTDNLESIFDAHTTSKLNSIEDLNTLLSMGFRGEALSTITSVAKVRVVSKYTEEDFGNEIVYNEEGKSSVKKSPKEQGTSIVVQNIFYNIPARKKYLKTAQTEYRKIYELFIQYALVYPNIHFILEKDGKVVGELSVIENRKAGEITKERVEELIGDKEQFLPLHYDGNSIKVSGYISHPSSHKSRGGKSHIYINNRAVTDKGIIRAIYEGYSRFIPFGEKISFVINIGMDPQFVDINVHPRKEEVRFENPYRIYQAVENAVRHSLEKETSRENTYQDSNDRFAQLRDSFNQSTPKSSSDYTPTNIYGSSKKSSVQDTLLFSKELLRDQPTTEYKQSEIEESDIANIFQIFNKYIVIEFINETLWIIDQHAAAERINFERLLQGKENLEVQNFLVPPEVKMTKEELLFLDEHRAFFEDLGITYEIKDNVLNLKTTPVEFAEANFQKVFEEIFEMEDNVEDLKKNLKKRKDDVLATISCHNSIRSGQKLDRMTMLDLYNRLVKCKNPYSCPHGRPAIWKLKLSEIDSNFERTY